MSYFVKTCLALGLPAPIKEYRFHPKRKWRCDYFIPIYNPPVVGLAIELEGGLWASIRGGKSRHFYGEGAANDMIKYSALTEAGILLLRYQPKSIDYDQIKRVHERLKLAKKA